MRQHEIDRSVTRFWPLALTVAVFAVIFLRIPFGRFVDAIAGARLVPFVSVMASFSLFYFLMDTLILCRMVRWFHGPLAYRDLLPARATTYLVSIVNTQLAQGALALYIHRRFATPLAEITGTVAVLILLEITQLVLFATAGMLASLGTVPLGLFAAPIGLALVWILLVATLRGPESSTAVGRMRSSPLAQTFRRARPFQLVLVLALKGTILAAAILAHRVALGFFGIDVPASRLLAFLPIVFMVAALPITVAHLGTSQAAWIYFFGDRAPEASLLAYSLASHLTFMLANGLLGLGFLPRAYAELFGQARATEEASANTV
jgi:hypothetical protein